jgi:hypothetical protein
MIEELRALDQDIDERVETSGVDFVKEDLRVLLEDDEEGLLPPHYKKAYDILVNYKEPEPETVTVDREYLQSVLDVLNSKLAK